MREALCKSQFLERFQHSIGEKNYKFGGIRIGKRNSLTLFMSSFSQDKTAKGQENSSRA